VNDPLAAAAEPTRRRILQLLASGPMYAGDVAERFDVTRSAISQHLGVLTEVGLVSAEQQGRQRLYRVEPSGIARLQAEIASFWTMSSTSSSETPTAWPTPVVPHPHPRRRHEHRHEPRRRPDLQLDRRPADQLGRGPQ
jgi:DNA-binding transcriptional ArsR family regulator